MGLPENGMNFPKDRRERLHELLLALIARAEELPLMDEDVPEPTGGGLSLIHI